MNHHPSHNDKSMEDLFRNAFAEHKELTHEGEADQFLQQLEETGFFDAKRKRPVYLFLFVGFSLVVGVLLYYFFFSEKSDTTQPGLVKKQTLPVTVEDHTPIPTSSTGEVANESVKRNPAVKSPVAEYLLLPDKPEEEDRTVPKEADLRTMVIDSVPPAVHKIRAKDSVRVQYVIEVDTIKTIDSLNIKKRKWDKMKGKKQ